MANFRLRVVTPEHTVFDESVAEIVTRSVEGELGVLAHHMPLITPLVPHTMTLYLDAEGTRSIVVSGGFMEVGSEGVLILADAAETPDQIDVGRAEAARERAETRLGGGAADIDLARAKRALARAENRLQATGHHSGASTPTH